MDEPKAVSQVPERLRKSAVDFPLMIVISTVYPCNFGCPNCPYTDGNSEIRSYYSSKGGDYLPQELWNKIADEAGPYGAWLRCTGGGEPMMHPLMVEMVEYAKGKGARVWMNTNGSLFGPARNRRGNLRRLIEAGVDLIEFSMDAGDASTYKDVRPPIAGTGGDPEKRWFGQVSNVRAALEMRKLAHSKTRIVVSMIRQKRLAPTLEAAQNFWLQEVGVDEVITRKFLSWDDNTAIDLQGSMDGRLYSTDWQRPDGPCVWPFERLNVDTLGRVALCGQDISFRTAKLFPNVNETSIRDIWRGKIFTEYRKHHMTGTGDTLFPCKGCSAWHAGIRDWNYGWIQVLDSSARGVVDMFRKDLGYEVDVFTPEP